jgi:hypothetical protein
MNLAPVIAALAVTLCACASYELPQGDANYDAIKAASDECQAKGGKIELRSGYDGRQLSSYQCKIGGAK